MRLGLYAKYFNFSVPPSSQGGLVVCTKIVSLFLLHGVDALVSGR